LTGSVAAAENLLSALLEEDGHQTVVAYSGEEGIAKAHAFRPEVVLCDLGLPDIHGFEVARTFLADNALKSARLVALSDYVLPEDVHRATEAGFDHHLAKPFDLDKLRALLRA
jgi:CheY-like chemotaxis protein